MCFSDAQEGDKPVFAPLKQKILKSKMFGCMQGREIPAINKAVEFFFRCWI